MRVNHSTHTIAFDDVSFHYPGRPEVLKDVSFSIQGGSYVGIVGPNGGGKSTLLHLMVGVLTPTNGTIHIFGHSIHDAHHHIDIGFVPQRASQDLTFFPATVEEIVASGRIRHHVLHKHDDHDMLAIDEALSITDILDLRKRRIGTLSGGQMQRVMIARSLAAKPEVLLLDEPTVGVDRPSQKAFYELLRRLHTELKLTILLVSHDISAVEHDLTDMLYVDGAVRQDVRSSFGFHV